MQPRLLRLFATVVAAVGFLTHAPRASADTLTLDLTGGGNGYNGGGPFNWTQTSPPNLNYATTLTTYCIDVQKYVPGVGSAATYTVTSLNNAPTISSNNISANAQSAQYLPTAVNNINTLFDHFYSSSFASSVQSAAFQLALWDLVYGAKNPILTGYLNSFPAGNEQGDTAQIIAAANSMLSGAAYNGTEHDLTGFKLVALVSGGNQDQILVVPNPAVKGVPAPPAVMLAGIGVLALLGRNRWTRRTTAAA